LWRGKQTVSEMAVISVLFYKQQERLTILPRRFLLLPSKTNQYVNIWNRLERIAEFATGFSPSGETEKMALNI
jgi:hypothetical protein